MNQKVFTKGEVLKAVPDKLFKAKCDLYGYASVEVPDREGDIIRVKGIRFPETPVKVAPSHKYGNPLEVLGTVKEWTVTTKSVKGKQVPALAFGLEWARGEGNEITPFAKQYKGLYDNGVLDSFSGGFDPNPEKVLALKGGRYDVLECEAVELSCCMIPMNPYATVMKALADAIGEDFDKAAYLEEKITEIINDRVCGLNDSLLKAFHNRFDDFESKYVSKSDDAGLTADRRIPQLDTSEVLKALNATLAKLK